jgi:peptidyl-tRNA hydrolase, PTH1 family
VGLARLVVGLGNPGRKYENSRHNVGFVALDALRAGLGVPEYREKFAGAFTRGDGQGAAVALLKPMTFMNLSGQSVQSAMAFLKIEPADVLVLHDELDLAFADVRIKVGGGHAGHNGLRSLIEQIGSTDFVRVRIGIGRPLPGFRGEVADYVLSSFDPSERAQLDDVVARSVDAVRKILTLGVPAAMNRVNAKGVARNAPPK